MNHEWVGIAVLTVVFTHAPCVEAIERYSAWTSVVSAARDGGHGQMTLVATSISQVRKLSSS